MSMMLAMHLREAYMSSKLPESLEKLPERAKPKVPYTMEVFEI
jgi:hypothetical protein